MLVATPAAAATDAEIERLWQAMQMDTVLEVMRDEGIDYGHDLDRDMLGGSGGPGFAAAVDAIYQTEPMRARARADFAAELADDDVAPMVAFFETELGARIIELEISARQALLDPDVETASLEAVAALEADAAPRFGQLQEFTEVNDLVESNLMGALNASYAFYLGLNDTNAVADRVGEQDILTDVWSQEEAIRTDTQDWVNSFIGLAYQPLSDAEFDAYIDFSATPEGRQLNRAIFTAYDGLFVDVSRRLGRTVGTYLQGEAL
jgi:hypothetical protein